MRSPPLSTTLVPTPLPLPASHMHARCLLQVQRACLAGPIARRLLLGLDGPAPTQRSRRSCQTCSMAAKALQVRQHGAAKRKRGEPNLGSSCAAAQTPLRRLPWARRLVGASTEAAASPLAFCAHQHALFSTQCIRAIYYPPLQEPTIIEAVVCDHRNVTAMMGRCLQARARALPLLPRSACPRPPGAAWPPDGLDRGASYHGMAATESWLLDLLLTNSLGCLPCFPVLGWPCFRQAVKHGDHKLLPGLPGDQLTCTDWLPCPASGRPQ